MQSDVAQPTQSIPRRLAKLIVLSCLGGALVWAIVTRSLVSYLSEVAPERALSIAPATSAALVRRSEIAMTPIRQRRFAEAERAAAAAREAATAARQSTGAPAAVNPVEPHTPSPEELEKSEQVVEWARQALAASPLSVTALRILGEVAEMKGDRSAANKLMTVAAARWRHESPAVYHVMLASLEAKDYAATVDHADALLRARPELWAAIAPVLVHIVESGQEGTDLVIARLARKPAWRRSLLSAMTEVSTDVRTPLTLLLGLKNAGSPADHVDLASYLQFLLRQGHFEVAYYAWLQLLPPEQLSTVKLVFNGDFDQPLSNLPMDWNLRDGIGARLEIAPHTADNPDRALRVELGPDRVQFGRLQQWLVLPPGAYTLTGRFRGTINGRRGLRWRVHCVNRNEAVIGETPMIVGTQRNWRDFETNFVIPETDCRAQHLRLEFDARYSAEQFATGVGWFDGIDITRR